MLIFSDLYVIYATDVTYQPDFSRAAHFAMWLKDPAVIGQKCFEDVTHQQDEGKPHSCGEQDGAEHRLCLNRHKVTTWQTGKTDVKRKINNIK